MIYTVTLNPAIDYIVRLDHVETGAVNRMASEDKFAGGKGINAVSYTHLNNKMNYFNVGKIVNTQG